MPKTIVTKKRINVTVDAELVAEAHALGVTISRACEDGLRAEVAAREAEQGAARKRDS